MLPTVLSRCLALSLAGLALASCASRASAPATFELSAPPPATVRNASTRAQILIAEPTATQAIARQQIVVRPTPQTIENLAGSQWSDDLPRLVQLRLLQAFQNTGRVGAVGVPGQGLAIDYQVVTEIRRFEIALTPSPVAVVEIAVKALNDRTGVVRSTRIFRNEQPVNGAALGTEAGNASFVSALDTAFGGVADEIVSWTINLL